LTAVRKLKRDYIAASVLTGVDADQATILEIIENLKRADLSPSERAFNIDLLKRLEDPNEDMRGKTPGAGRGKKKRSQEAQDELFVKRTAKKTGMGRSTVQRDATRGKKGRGWLKRVAGTCLDKGDEIDALIKLPAMASPQ
jgi:hypothetical protein